MSGLDDLRVDGEGRRERGGPSRQRGMPLGGGDGTLRLADGRLVGFTDYGPPNGVGVLWCHGGPGSHHEPVRLAPRAHQLGLRLVGIDRPGYGSSTPQPGRTIAGWVPHALTVADHLGIDRFVTVGVSTGGAYALALAAAPASQARTLAVVACCALTNMRWGPARDGMSRLHALAVWDAPDRDTAIAAAVDSHGTDGRRLLAGGPVLLPPADRALLADLDWRRWLVADLPTMFAWGVEGYVDDRIADRPGWQTFDVASITCPVAVVHGTPDVIAPVAHARHTADIVPTATLRLLDGHGHFSVEDHILPTINDLLASPSTPTTLPG